MKLLKSSVLGLCGAFLLCGCASYRVKPLRKLTKETAQYTQEKDNICVCASRLNKKEFKEYTNGHTFSAQKKLVPVLVTIYNNGKSDLVWRAQEAGLALLSADEAAQFLFYGTGFIIPVGVGSFFGFVLGSLIIMRCGHAFQMFCSPISPILSAILCGSAIIVYTGAFPLAACIMVSSYYGHSSFNNMLLVDLREKILSRVDLAPGDGVSKLLITHEQELAKPFAMSLRTLGTEKTIEFIIDLSTQDHNRD